MRVSLCHCTDQVGMYIFYWRKFDIIVKSESRISMQKSDEHLIMCRVKHTNRRIQNMTNGKSLLFHLNSINSFQYQYLVLYRISLRLDSIPGHIPDNGYTNLRSRVSVQLCAATDNRHIRCIKFH